jgi:hypothetical protein
MSLENAIIAGVIFEREAITQGRALAADGRDERLHINHYGRKMLRFAERGKIKSTDSNEDIAAALSSGVIVWLFWQIAPDLLMWIIAAMRKRIWPSNQESRDSER